MNNIAEGYRRMTPRGQRYFYEIAKGSTYECVNILFLIRDRGLISEERLRQLYQAGNEIAAMLTGLITAAAEKENAIRPSRSVKEAHAPYQPADDIGGTDSLHVPPL